MGHRRESRLERLAWDVWQVLMTLQMLRGYSALMRFATQVRGGAVAV